MIITCANCQTKFKVDDALIKKTGTRVRCSNCQNVFTVFLPQSRETVAPPARTPIPRPPLGPPAPARSFEPVDVGRREGAQANPPSLGALTAKSLRQAEGDFLIPPEPPAPEETPPPPLEPPVPPREPEGPAPAADGLGLGDDPTLLPAPENPPREGPQTETGAPSLFDFDPDQDPREEVVRPRPNPIKPRSRKPDRRKTLYLAGAIVLALILASALFLSLKGSVTRSAPSALQSADPLEPGFGEEGAPEGESGADETAGAENSTEKLNFAQNNTTHHYRKNASAGNILIITGRIANNFEDRRSFIRVRGLLKGADGVVVAQREAFAGNYLTEQELVTLPMSEILARLQIRGGQNSSNLNVMPGDSVPFMLVFDKLPADLDEYVVECVSSVSAGPPPPPPAPAPASD
ncbi:MAG: zinc-ribbon domain-containing protein [Deltaproteobacteria bacterium]|jgi:predicted Zn finger-like uncharacterized protein|nr:zinc-ribbon domain-containing protein [Deltaproteobacteria bacterium]